VIVIKIGEPCIFFLNSKKIKYIAGGLTTQCHKTTLTLENTLNDTTYHCIDYELVIVDRTESECLSQYITMREYTGAVNHCLKQALIVLKRIASTVWNTVDPKSAQDRNNICLLRYIPAESQVMQ
jgi:hypothetical protein